MKKILILLLCIVGFVACSDSKDDPNLPPTEVNPGEKPEDPEEEVETKPIPTLYNLRTEGELDLHYFEFSYNDDGTVSKIDLDGASGELFYDEKGVLEKITLGGYEHKIHYKSATEVIVIEEERDWDACKMTFDEKGQLLSLADDSRTRKFIYDEKGNITTCIFNDGLRDRQEVNFQYSDEPSVMDAKIITPLIFSILLELCEENYIFGLLSKNRMIFANKEIITEIDESGNVSVSEGYDY